MFQTHLLLRADFFLTTSQAQRTNYRVFEQRHIKVPRSARYAILASLAADLREVWFVCHGHCQLAARFLARFLPLESDDRLFIAPEALSRYYLSPPVAGPHPPQTPIGASWMTAEDRESEIDDYVSYLDLLHDEIFSVVDRTQLRIPYEVVRFKGGHTITPELLEKLTKSSND